MSPDGSRFAITCLNANAVQVYDLASRTLTRTFSNPVSGLDHPHGITMTDRFLIVGNKMDPEDRPALLQVFDLDRHDERPVHELITPLPYLREAHSMSLSGNRLLVTYAGTGRRALVCYDFDPASGRIGSLLDSCEEWFTGFGTPKGVSFSPCGETALVTFMSAKRIPSTPAQRMGRAMWLLRQPRGSVRLAKRVGVKLGELLRQGRLSAGEHSTDKNGVAVFTVSSAGKISREPVNVHLDSGYTRLENIDVAGDRLVLSDPMRGEVLLSRFAGNGLPDTPEEVINQNLFFPHCARLSRDGSLLLIANNGVRVENNKPQWHAFTQERTDGIAIYRRAPSDWQAAALTP